MRAMMTGAALLGLLAACVHPSQVTTLMEGAPGGPPIARIAVAPAVGSIDELAARALEREGYEVLDPSAIARLLAVHHLGEGSLDRREVLEVLASEGVDAFLIAASEYPGWVLKSPKYVDVDSYPPEKVAVHLIRTASGDVLTAFVWENGWCAMRGSPCDFRQKLSVYEASKHVAGLVLRSIGPPAGYLIDAAPDDGTVVISGVAFKKLGDCPGFVSGQRVRFAAGSRFSTCTKAKLVLVRSGDECDVECPEPND